MYDKKFVQKIKHISLSLVLIIILIMILIVTGSRLIVLHHRTEEVSSTISKDKEDKIFFDNLIVNELLFPINSTSQILKFAHEDKSYEFKELLETETDSEKTQILENKIYLLKGLYKSQVGQAVQKAVRLWNNAHFFSAIRDNRPLKTNILKLHSWKAMDSKHHNLYLKTTSQIPEFGVFVSAGTMKPGFHEWIGAFTEIGAIKFSTKIQINTPKTVTIQLIGKFLNVSASSCLKTDIKTKQRKINGKQNPAFQELKSSETYPGCEITIPLSKGEHTISIIAKPVEFYKNKIPGYNISWAYKKSWPECIAWQDTSKKKSKKPSVFSVETSDGIKLLTPEGTLTNKIWETGLSPIIGSYKGERNTLSGLLSSAKHNGNITLTIDYKLQNIVKTALETQIQELWKNDKYAELRRGAVVLLDADTGEILAAFSYPKLQAGVNSWDLKAFATYYPSKSLQVFRPWKGIDRHNAPGSTFKPVVAMSAILAIQDNISNKNDIEKFIIGYSKKQFSKSGITISCAGYNPLTRKCYTSRRISSNKVVVSNFKNFPVGRGFTTHKDKILGLREAIRDSINIWFVRLGQLVDGEKAKSYDIKRKKLLENQPLPERPRFYLGQMAKKLGFQFQSMDLLFNLKDHIHLERNIPANKREGDSLFAVTGKMSLLDEKKQGLEKILAQTSFGQGITASPLQMAKIAATIATGKLHKPYIVKKLNDMEMEHSQGVDINLKDKLMILIRNGMKAVPENGSAKNAFKGYPNLNKIYGKTGTSNVAIEKKIWTTWFMGYKDPVKPNDRRIAFACMVTHATGKGKNTGGYVAAPVIRKIFDKID